MDLVFATHNTHKIEEVRPLLPAKICLQTLENLGCTYDIPETGATLEDNALLKARYIMETYGKACFADDTGLLVKTLDGAPGVHSARYAGEQRSSVDNIGKLLLALGENKVREARFETVIALVWDGGTRIFRGAVKGSIAQSPSGNNGFGYDPVFIPDGYDQTFADLSLAEKNRISHRARALQKLISFLSNQDFLVSLV